MSALSAYLTFASVNAMLNALAKGTSSSAFRSTASVKVQLLDGTFVYSPSKGYLSDIAAGERVGSPVACSGFTVANGILDASDPSTFTALTGDDVYWWAVYDDSGVEATSMVLFYIKSFVNRPTAPNGQNVTAAWSNEVTSKILYYAFPDA